VGALAEATAADGRMTEPRAKAWAQLFDLRYRLLLGRLAHFLRSEAGVTGSSVKRNG
jgi:hypothetical protein